MKINVSNWFVSAVVLPVVGLGSIIAVRTLQTHVMHQVVPTFTTHDANQEKHSIAEVIEVHRFVQMNAVLDGTKEYDSNIRVRDDDNTLF